MKALLIKDFKLLKNQKTFFATFGLLGIVFILVFDDPTFSIFYMTIALSSFVQSTIAYDNYNDGAAYLFSLPVNRREYVREKYIYNFIMTGSAILFTGVLSGIVLHIRQRGIPGGYILTCMIAAFVIANISNALTIPIDLKFKPDKIRFCSMLVWGLLVVLGLLFTFICDKIGVNMYDLIGKLFTDYRVQMLLAAGVVMVGVMLLSYLCSVRIMERKEF
ncbi:ABC-2 transporter permease [Roseburia hominis]